jgi:hypothetical protein
MKNLVLKHGASFDRKLVKKNFPINIEGLVQDKNNYFQEEFYKQMIIMRRMIDFRENERTEISLID